MRQRIQYDLDDSTGPSKYMAIQPTQGHYRQPPPKKRKRSHQHVHTPSQTHPKRPPIQHWDDPGSPTDGMVYDEQEDGEDGVHRAAVGSGSCDQEEAYEYEDGEGDYGNDGMDEEEEEESRELTHQEIWDDSALIDAWNSAEAEYEAYHGNSKEWKTDLVKPSPLWYNKPYTAPTTQAPTASKSKPIVPEHPSTNIPPQPAEEESNTAPLDFHTFVPTHDPSLPVPSDFMPRAPAQVAQSASPFFVPASSTTMVSRDEAFSNALSAMYWGGYWTAVYHCQSQSSSEKRTAPQEATEEDEEGAYDGEVDVDEDGEDLVPAQR
ncbi:hypothetical protein PAXRUDRAFT_132578 [Paxillus rubicundulus Ve08.2h10]|uniref:Unplaced genomic scaffold scaffold_44, whole genome shotgun sequence n=1 Tax=Paxillus rubicundulus Ve08.2h10 TaxID=930991 RepID=A0A0D0DVW8_9AGAM|nr:hypothetical protein PAXRUDRAFT_132578 [Paxillus rubicundulus Ve08.2h10]